MKLINSSSPMLSVLKDQSDLISWYEQNRRDLPWRKSTDPYRIWISEVMLQQTTVAAVIPYYEKFMKKFPTLKSLSKAKENEVLEFWAGLGYYSRARNLHRASQILAQAEFPRTASQLLNYPGFGPYTSRAVASLAFGEKVGVLDGNVIRVLSRRYGHQLDWWNSKEKEILQKISDQLAQTEKNSSVNQGLMELGATICTPKKPLCLLCPWKSRCVALKTDRIAWLPTPKPKVKSEIWHWVVKTKIRKNQIYLAPLTTTPFLKNLYFPESSVQKVNKKPKSFDLKHGVTKYALYITIKNFEDFPKSKSRPAGRWVNIKDIKKLNPTSLMTKILNFSQKSERLK